MEGFIHNGCFGGHIGDFSPPPLRKVDEWGLIVAPSHTEVQTFLESDDSVDWTPQQETNHFSLHFFF